MADLLLKKGSYSDFKSKILDKTAAVEGTLYFTEDEGGLYLGKADKTVVRIQGTVHQYETLTDFTSDITPPYSTDVIYFIADKNALVRWDGSNWIQLNTPASVSAQMQTDIKTNAENIESLSDTVGALEKTVSDNKTATDAAISGLGGRVTAAEGNIESLQEQLATKANQSDFEELSQTVVEQGDAITNIQNNYVTNETFNTTVEDINADIKEINDALGLEGDGTTTIVSRIEALETDNTTNKENIAENATNIQELSDGLGTTNTNLSNLTERVTTAEGNITTLQQDLDVAEGNITTLQQDLDVAEGNIENLTGRVETAEGQIEDLTDAVGNLESNSATKDELNDLNTALSKDIEALETKTDTTNTNLNNLTTRVTTAEGTISDHTTQIGEIVDTIGILATKDELSDLSDELKAEIDADIIAANAMTYKGGVDGKTTDTSLPTTGVAIGDTYVVTEAFVLDGVTVQPGDLLIAQGTEVNGTIDPDTLVWDYVATGYSDIHNPQLTVANNVITLSDFANNPIGQVTLNSNSENIVISTDADNNIVNFNFQWGTF